MTIKSSDVVFRYGNNEVLSGLTFSVPEGEVTYLAGENGSGKTTWILNAVNLLRLKDGKILYDGKSFDEVRTRISVSFDTTPLYPYLSVEENLKLFQEMREGKYADGEKTLRAKIDMSHPNMNMRDPVIYRILHVPHHRQGNKWCIYPMYDCERQNRKSKE